MRDRRWESNKSWFFAVQHLPPIISPLDAVRTAMIQEHREAKNTPIGISYKAKRADLFHVEHSAKP